MELKHIAAVITLTAAATSSHGNLVINGSFENGNAGFTSDYSHQSDLFPEHTYFIGSNPRDYHFSFRPISAQSGTNMMIVNGAGAPDQVVWGQGGISVLPNTTYYFSTWIASVYPISPADLSFSINGNSIGSLTANLDGGWNLFFATWNSGANSVANISLVDRNRDANGNDFALDNISLTANPVPTPSTLFLASLALGCALFQGWRSREEKGSVLN